MSKEILEIQTIKTIIDNEADDVFISSGSPEIRCLGTLKKLDEKYRANQIFILKYSHKNEKREKNLKEMHQILSKIGPIEEFLIDEELTMPMISEIIQKIEKQTRGSASPKITIDVTTLIKWHILVLLNMLDKKNLLHKCRFLYTEPEEYIIDLFQPLSFGIKQIFPIPLFSGNYNFAKDCLLVIFLGYEGNRAMALLENIDPTECLLLIPKPAYHSEWEGRTEEMNKEIINIVGNSNIKYIDSRNPVLVATQLKTILSESCSKYNCLISPMGTKPQTFGLYLYWTTNPADTSLIYNAPLRHNNLFYSEGIGKIWKLPTEIDS